MPSIVGRPRTRRKDLPPGLHWDAAHGWYYRATRQGDRRFVAIGKADAKGRSLTREHAIRAWVRITGLRPELEPPRVGTFAELLDAYRERALPLVKADATRAEYERMLPKLRELWGEQRFAKTADEAVRGGFLLPGTFSSYLDGFRRGERGAVQANRYVRLVSAVFSWARSRSLTLFNPAEGVLYVPEAGSRTKAVDDATRGTLAEAAHPALALLMELGALTGMRKTDLRLLLLSHVGADGYIHVRPSKTAGRGGKAQAFEITAAVRAVLDRAATLPGRNRSLYVFPTRKGTPYSESGLQSAWRRARARAGIDGAVFRGIRKAAINEKHAQGGNAADFAGHADPRTTHRHYLTQPVKVRPLK